MSIISANGSLCTILTGSVDPFRKAIDEIKIVRVSQEAFNISLHFKDKRPSLHYEVQNEHISYKKGDQEDGKDIQDRLYIENDISDNNSVKMIIKGKRLTKLITEVGARFRPMCLTGGVGIFSALTSLAAIKVNSYFFAIILILETMYAVKLFVKDKRRYDKANFNLYNKIVTIINFFELTGRKPKINIPKGLIPILTK